MQNLNIIRCNEISLGEGLLMQYSLLQMRFIYHL